MVNIISKVCKHCGGNLIWDEDEKCLKCMMCGRLLGGGQPSQGTQVEVKKQLPPDHKEAIVKVTGKELEKADVPYIPTVKEEQSVSSVPTQERVNSKDRGESEMVSTEIFVVPDLGGMENHEKGRFYAEHRDDILKDFETLGGIEMRSKWQMSDSGWCGLKKRWRRQGIEINDHKRGRKQSKVNRIPRPPQSSPGMSEHDELLQLRGYRLAVLDIFGKRD